MHASSNPAAWADLSTNSSYAAIAGVAVSCGALLLLHLLGRQFDPSWRMVSEYANGPHKWLLTIVFFSWALSSFALLVALLPIASTTLGKAGIALLALAGIGQLMGGLFDINHKLHGPAAMIGIPALCAAAVVVTMSLARRSDIAAPPAWSAHLPWISFALMIASLVLFITSLKSAGVDLSAQNGPLSELPQGVTGYVGWANRLLFGASYLWALLTSAAIIRAAD
ncbi:MAG TPA: DUF998 domain-containing protein [Sphingomicrobium sp.]